MMQEGDQPQPYKEASEHGKLDIWLPDVRPKLLLLKLSNLQCLVMTVKLTNGEPQALKEKITLSLLVL